MRIFFGKEFFMDTERSGAKLGWVGLLLPVTAAVLLCALVSGGAEHNMAVMESCFYGTPLPEDTPAEFSEYVFHIRSIFAELDTSIAEINNQMTEGNGLDPLWVKAVFFALHASGATLPEDVSEFASCFYTFSSEHTAAPVPEEAAYANLASLLNRPIIDEDRANIAAVYEMVSGTVGGRGYAGDYLRGGQTADNLDTSAFTDPTTKNTADLAAYAVHAWESGWGYVWGTYGTVLTESLLSYKLEQYPEGVGQHEAFIRTHWLNRRTTDCVGLIKGYAWLNPETLTLNYAANGMPDVGANQMFRAATVSGPIETIPNLPGLAVWMDGHIGVYIGDGEVIEAMGTRQGVVKTNLTGRGWTHWLEIPYIQY
ncbi:MAG: hypothetical protein IJC43_03340 [Clostridia bacterium]|nr:hypothetical protein [Clostridia bacterium]